MIDSTDRRILTILQSDGRLTNQQIAEQTGISAAACWRRMRALEEKKIISGYSALLNRKALGLDFCIFVHVSLSRHMAENVTQFEKAILQRPEVLECHATTGDSDFMLKVITDSIESYDRFLEEFLFSQPGIGQVKTHITLREIKYETQLPLPR